MQRYDKFVRSEYLPLINCDGTPTYQIMVSKFYPRTGVHSFDEITDRKIPGMTFPQMMERQRACNYASTIFNLHSDEVTEYFEADHPADKRAVLNATIDYLLQMGDYSDAVLQKFYRVRCLIDPPNYAVINLCAWNIDRVKMKENKGRREYRIPLSEFMEIGRMFLHPNPKKDLCYKGENFIIYALALMSPESSHTYYLLIDCFKEYTDTGYVPIKVLEKNGYNIHHLAAGIQAGKIHSIDDTVSIIDLSAHYRKSKNFDELYEYLSEAKHLCRIVGYHTKKIDQVLSIIKDIQKQILIPFNN